MRRRTAASRFCWVGSPWPRFIGIGAAAVVISQAVTVSAQQSAGAQSVSLPTTATATAPKTQDQTESTTATTQPAAAATTATPTASPANSDTATATAPAAPVTAGATAAVPAASSIESPEPLLTDDELTVPGYMPGYRRHVGLGMSPFTPANDAFAGGITPEYGAPQSPQDWTFKYSGYANITLQPSLYKRHEVLDGQNTWAFHTNPMTIDEWYSFTSTATVPGNWVNLNFQYGNSKVAAVTSIDTYNPSEPTTYYQLGSQYFINNAYLSFSPSAVAGIRLHCDAGMLSRTYGGLSRYGSGMYVNPLAGILRGIGEITTAEYDLTDKITLTAEHGFMTWRNGRVASNVISAPVNGYIRPTWPASWIHHAHAGFYTKSETRFQLQLHYIRNWAQDERVQMAFDNPVTRQLNEADIKDSSISVYSADARLIHDVWGYLAGGVSYLHMKHAFPVKGLMTYGGDGEMVSDRWLGLPADGTGKMLVAAINYGVSLGKVVAHPRPFAGDGPDIVINTGFHWATTWQDYKQWNHRNRYKGAMDVLYTFLRNVGVGGRFDAVVPNSKDMDETFYVLAGRIQLKTDWTSHEQINLIYARWFYGSNTRNEGTGERTPERLDSQLLALNFNMWW